VTQSLLVTLPAFTQRVQTRSRLGTPPTTVRTETRFGSHRRLVTLCAWLIRLPTAGCFPQTAQRWAMTVLLSLVAGRGLPLSHRRLNEAHWWPDPIVRPPPPRPRASTPRSSASKAWGP